MKAKNSPFKQVYFRLNQNIYKWGIGFIISKESIAQWEKETLEVLAQLNLKITNKILDSSCNEGLNDIGENLYMHPMDFSGTIHKDNIEKYIEVLKSFKTKFWSFDRVDVFDLIDESNGLSSISKVEQNKKKYLDIKK